MHTRQQVVDAARSLLGVKFTHRGRNPGLEGIDCIGLIVNVARLIGMVYKDNVLYDRHPDGRTLMAEFRAQLREIKNELARPGDVLVFRIRRRPQHTGIMTDLGVVHTWSDMGRVVEHRLDPWWSSRIVFAFQFPGSLD